MFIRTENAFQPQISYIPFGTIGYVKTIHNNIRQCKCVGGRTKPVEEGKDRYAIQYEWKVAGYKEHFFTFSCCCLPIGHIYKDEVSAQRGTANTERGNHRPDKGPGRRNLFLLHFIYIGLIDTNHHMPGIDL